MFILKKNNLIKSVIVYILFMFCNTPCWAKSSYIIHNAGGGNISDINLTFGSIFNDQVSITTNNYQVLLKGKQGAFYLFGTANNCFIGANQITDSNIKVMLNNKSVLPVNEALSLSNFPISIELENPLKYTGSISCSEILIFASDDNTEYILSITVAGEVLITPRWIGSSGSVINGISFSFSNLISSSNANANIDSQPFSTKLEHATSGLVSVQLTLPSSCKIGNNSINDSDVQLKYNSSVISSDTSFNITTDMFHNFALRFSASGGYGKQFGAVSCGSSGSLTFTY